MRKSGFLVVFLLCMFVVAGAANAQKVQAEASLDHGGPVPAGGLEDCTGFQFYEQPLDGGNFGVARTSDAETAFAVAEDTVDGAGTITPLAGTTSGIRFWGITFDFIATFACGDDAAGTPFDITFMADAGGAPGAAVATVTGVSPTIVDTGIPFAATTIAEYSATFPGVDVTGAAWVEIVRQTGVAGCNWLWVDESLMGTYDDMANQTTIGTVTSDHTMCLAPAGAPATPAPALAILMLLLLAISAFMLYRRKSLA